MVEGDQRRSGLPSNSGAGSFRQAALREHPPQDTAGCSSAAIALRTLLGSAAAVPQLIAEAAVLAACAPRHRNRPRRSCASSVCPSKAGPFGRAGRLGPAIDQPAPAAPRPGCGIQRGRFWSGFGGSGALSHPARRRRR